MTAAPDPLSSVPIRVANALAGCGYALRFGDGPIMLSPEHMLEVRGVSGNPKLLAEVLAKIPLKTLPPMPDFLAPGYVPMVTRPGSGVFGDTALAGGRSGVGADKDAAAGENRS